MDTFIFMINFYLVFVLSGAFIYGYCERDLDLDKAKDYFAFLLFPITVPVVLIGIFLIFVVAVAYLPLILFAKIGQFLGRIIYKEV